MTKVYFKRGLASDYGPNEPNLEDSIIFKSYVDPQFPGFSEVYLGSKLVGVGHTFGYGVKGLVPAPSDNDNGKILSTDGWTDPKDLAGLDKVLQNPISGSSQSRYPLILKGTADNTTETNSVNFSARYKYGNPILSATAGGDLFAKSLAVTELVKSPGFLVSNPNGSPISGLTSDTYIKADGSGYGGVFTGAGEAAGSAGLVPAPAIGDAGKYLKGDGTWGEIQSGSDLATPVTYSELVTLKTGGNLVPGMQYRITDYTCTTKQANTQSAGNQFDIIVTADSETELNENARAAHHINTISYQILPNQSTNFTYPSWMSEQSVSDALGDLVPVGNDMISRISDAKFIMYYNGQWIGDFETLTPGTEYKYTSHDSNTRTLTFSASDTYFANCNLDSWELKYCLENDTNRFAWADDGMEMSLNISVIAPNNPPTQVDTTASLVSRGDRWKWKIAYNNSYVYTVPNPTVESQLYGSATGTGTVSGTINGVYSNGKGVIYYMKDEWNNECPYDFKNIKFKRWAVTAYQNCPSLVVNNSDNSYGYYYGAKSLNGNNVLSSATYGNDFGWFYTFALKDLESGDWFDYTVVSNLGLKNDDDCEVACYDNHLEAVTDEYSSGKGEMAKMLNNIVFFNCYTDLTDTSYSDEYSYCNNNRFLGNCHSNTFGNGCGGNTFGNSCFQNSFGNGCYNNSFGNVCSINTFGNGCGGNTFGNSCFQNSFGNGCYNNSFGNNCNNNSFGNNFNSNTFENSCYGNIFGNYCHNNSFGNNCGDNLFGNNCFRNTFGNGCVAIRFSNSSGTARNYYQYIIVESGNQYINLDCTGTLSNSSIFENVKIAQGVNNTSTYKTIQDSRTNQTFQTVYQPKDSEVISVA